MLIDFGLALRFDSPPTARTTLLTDYQASRRVGVFGYMAPELWRCEPYGSAVDVFALGATLQRLLNAARPLSCTASLRSAARHTLWDFFQTGYETPSLTQYNALRLEFTPRVHAMGEHGSHDARV
jgi:serine/threonine protein kinase